MLSGDAVAQNNTVPTNVSSINSSFVFIVAGSSGSGGNNRIGRFTANGRPVTNVLEDTTTTASSLRRTLRPLRASAWTPQILPWHLHVHRPELPERTLDLRFLFKFFHAGIIQEQTANNNGAVDVADGTLAAQTGGPFASSNITGTYAINWSGLESPERRRIFPFKMKKTSSAR